jgi:hypothetical protein
MKHQRGKLESGKVGMCLNESSMNKNGKVGMYLEESLMRRWKGWDILEGRFNERVERLERT